MSEIVTSQPKARVLLVEDHEDTALLTSEFLQISGCAVAIAGTVKDAVAAVRAERFDVVVSDLGLPDGTGIDALREMRAAGCVAPAIALSGFGEVEDRTRTAAAGFAEHLIKPVDIHDLEAAIARALGTS